MGFLADLLATLGALVVVVVLYGLRLGNRWKYRHLKGPRGKWLVGCLADLKKHVTLDRASFHWVKDHGKMCATFLGGRVIVFVADPKLVKEVAVDGYGVQFLGRDSSIIDYLPVPGVEDDYSMLLWSKGELWKGLRRGWSSYLGHTQSLRFYAPIMNTAATRLLEVLGEFSRSTSPVDIKQAMHNFGLEVTGSTAFGVHFAAQIGLAPQSKLGPGARPEGMMDLGPGDGEAAKRLLRAAAAFFETMDFVKSPWLAASLVLPELFPIIKPVACLFPDKVLQRTRDARETLIAEAENIVRLQKEKLKGGSEKDGAQAGFVAGMFGTQDWTRGKEGLTTHQVVQQSILFLLAGYETTATHLTYTCWFLAKHPEIQQRLIRENRALLKELGRDNGVPEFDDLPKFKYLEAVMNESLRLLPPAPYFGRCADKDTTVGGKRIPEGTMMGVCLMPIHRSPDYWTDPDEFKPDRFLPDPATGRPREPLNDEQGAFMPFGIGPRQCVGKKFALEEAKIALIRIMDKLTFELTPGMEELVLKGGITVSPDGPVKLRVFAQ